MIAYFRDSRGVDQALPVIASFRDNEERFVILPRARGAYDTDEPYQVRKVGNDCQLRRA